MVQNRIGPLVSWRQKKRYQTRNLLIFFYFFSKCIFIFLSNIGMVPINQRTLELWKSGVKQRELLEHGDFMKIIMEHAFNEDGMSFCHIFYSSKCKFPFNIHKITSWFWFLGILCAAYRMFVDPFIPGGFKKCKLISSRLIDAFVPFLPLERRHVESCIRVIASEYSHFPINDQTIE